MPTDVSKILVLYGYLGAHFQRLEKPQGRPLEIENFFIEGEGLTKGVGGGSEAF